MINPDWNIFKARFSDNPQKNFEWFCYLLVCKEFDKPHGIFRYINQSGIETNPITKDSKEIGWQAKFYESSLSEYKEEIIGTITKTKRDYPNVTQIIFFTNSEWGQGKKQTEPKAKIDVERLAKELGITLLWRTASFFESPFVTVDNEIISSYFFSLDKNIIDLLRQRKMFNESYLFEIQTSIEFNKNKIQIDRDNLVKNLRKEIEQNQVVIISGVGGVGKTAIIKNIYEDQKDCIPFYIFKASEFDIKNINELLMNTSIQEFIKANKDSKDKVIVIDSAEKLLDIKNADPFKQFLFALIQNGWKIVITTRNNYLEDLNYEFFEIHRIIPINFDIQNLSVDELQELAKRFSFLLPTDEKILELIKNPFYLNEYLKFYKEDEKIGYLDFKAKLWNKIIYKSKPARENCFLTTSFQRANQGQFFVTPDYDQQILDELRKDGVLGYETAGYFITHDIYEEWALEKIIESEYFNKQSNEGFFDRIGESLPIRRSFRNWLSEKLLLENESIKQFIEEVIEEEDIKLFWKDEVLVSVLLSEYSANFFDIFREKLLDKDQKLIRKLSFILRIACKEVDDDFFKQLGIKDINILSIKYVFTKPKGKGWVSLIKFVYDNLNTIEVQNVHFILTIINEWNNKIKIGETTRLSSLIALKYYQWSIEEEVYFTRDDDVKDKLFQTIMNGASEIKEELCRVIDDVLNNKWKNHRDPYYSLVKAILTKLGDNMEVLKALPEKVLGLADLYWTRTVRKNKWYYDDSGIGVEKFFNIEEDYSDYYPASALQTPIYNLLRISLKETIDFILYFTDKSIECYAKSELGLNEVQEIDVYIEEGKYIKQYISNRIWNTYRGTQVNPYVLESMHMALEKYFIEGAKHVSSKALESWLLYMLMRTKSASISAIVVSIVLANPDKTFNVAEILFKTKEFFFFDLNRMHHDRTAKLNFSIGYGLNFQHKLHQDERIQSCDDEHRKGCLEHLALKYQFIRSKEISEIKADARQKVVWDILDNYYKELSDKACDTEFEKMWRLFLARMDRRKMNITTEKKDNQILISFDPELDSDLKEYSESAIKKSNESMKYSSLNLWAKYRFKNEGDYKNYEQYENEPQHVINQVREIVEGLKNPKDETTYLFNHAIPGYACSVLVRDYMDNLSYEDKVFCKDIIIGVASASLREGYSYQISDGVEPAIYVLPILIKEFPKERINIKTILLLTLFDSTNIGMYCEFSDYSKNAIVYSMWDNSFDDAQSLLFGYLVLKPKYDDIRRKTLEQNYKKNINKVNRNEFNKKFIKSNLTLINKVIENKIKFDNLDLIEDMNLSILKTSFELIPLKTQNTEHKLIIQTIISAFCKKALKEDRSRKIDYTTKYKFMRHLANFVLCSLSEQDIFNYLEPFVLNFDNSETFADFFTEFISAEDRLNYYNNFWYVWNLFYDKVVELSKEGDRRWYTEKILKSYLFAQSMWKEDVIEWHTLKESNKMFFKKIVENTGHCPSVLYSISKLLNNIGSIYLNDGVIWISKMISNNKNLWIDELDIDTIYYLENLIKKYIFLNRERIRKTKQLKQEVIIILNFLIERESVVGYLLRENLL